MAGNASSREEHALSTDAGLLLRLKLLQRQPGPLNRLRRRVVGLSLLLTIAPLYCCESQRGWPLAPLVMRLPQRFSVHRALEARRRLDCAETMAWTIACESRHLEWRGVDSGEPISVDN